MAEILFFLRNVFIYLVDIGHNPDKVTAGKDCDQEDQYGGYLLVSLLSEACLLVNSAWLADSFEEKIIEEREK